VTDPNDLRKIEKWMAENKADKMLTTNDPVAWMVARNGEPCHLSWTLGDARRELNRLELVSTGTPALELFSLYRSPALTDAERDAISEVVDCLTETGTALASPTTTRNTLAALLSRLA
jgi:hypothetical protein